MIADVLASAVRPPAAGSGALRAARRRSRRRAAIVVAGLSALLLALAVVALSVGDYPLAPADLVRTLAGGGARAESYVLFQVRAPRLAMGLLVGAALGAAGALLQALLRNPLASPDLLGISGGSSVAAVFVLLVVGVTGPLLAAGAFVGGIAVAGLLLLVGARRADGGYRTVLAGIGVAFFCSAVIGVLLVRAQIELAQAALVWITGSLASTPWWQVLTVLAVGVATVPFLVVVARELPLVRLGDQTATGLGVPIRRVRVTVVVVAVVLTAVTCAFAGPISFVALCAPAIARVLVAHGSIAIGTSAVAGAALLTAADLVAQYALPVSLPVGVVTGAVGAVFLLWLLATSKGRRT